MRRTTTGRGHRARRNPGHPLPGLVLRAGGDRRRRHLVALLEGREVGRLDWSLDRYDNADIDMVQVDGALCRRGIGRALLQRFLLDARREGIEQAQATVTWAGEERLLAGVLGEPRSIGDAVRDYTPEQVRRYLPDRVPGAEDHRYLDAYYDLLNAPVHRTRVRRTAHGLGDLPAFLRSTEAAVRWAEARGDLDRMASANGSDREDQEWQIGHFVDEAHRVARAGETSIYRAITVPASDDPAGVIDWRCVGGAWSAKPRGAQVIMEHPWKVPTEQVVLEGRVTAKHIDWKESFRLFLGYGLQEWEFRLEDGAPLLIDALVCDGHREIVFDPPRRANVGDAGGEWSSSACAQRWQERVGRLVPSARPVRPRGKAGAR